MFTKLIAIVSMSMTMSCASLAASPAARPRPLGRFEHVFAVLDEDTAKTIANAAYLREFCGFRDRGSVLADEGHYHGMYVFGSENYVELFGPAEFNLSKPPAPVGLVGLGLASEHHGDLDRIKTAMERAGSPAEIQSFHRNFNGRVVDWFRGLSTQSTIDNTLEQSAVPIAEIFVAEIIPSYFDQPEADKPPALGPEDALSLARYHRRDYANRLLKNITGVTMAITADDWKTMRAVLVGSGFRVAEGGAGARASGDVELTFQFVPRAEVGLRRIDFALTAAPGRSHVEVLGRSRLIVGPSATAVWTFDPARAALWNESRVHVAIVDVR